MQINLIFTREVLLLASFCKREFLELANGLFFTLCESLSQSMSFPLYKTVPQQNQDIKKCFLQQIFTILQVCFWAVFVAQLFLLHTMCEIFRHFLLSLDCATAQMKLNFWLGLSGKQGQNPCFWPPAVYQDLSIGLLHKPPSNCKSG